VSRRFLLIAALLTAATDGAAEVTLPYRAEARVAQIEKALAAVAATPQGLLLQGRDYARTLARGACSAGEQRLRVECLMVAVQRYCRDLGGVEAARCPFAMDVIVSNVLADENLIPLERRYQIVQANADSRAALAAELRRIQGRLAVDFRLAKGHARSPDVLAADIDQYCLATADKTKFSYQTCVSSLVWFIEEPPADAGRNDTR
jgi:hypothetical protein